MSQQRFPSIGGFEIEAVIGRGGFGTVYQARQTGLGRTVAVKVIRSDSQDPEVLRRFERECQAIGSLTGHPAVVTIFEAGTTNDGDPYMALEYLPGGSLQDRLAKGSLGDVEALDAGIAVAEALSAAHELGIIHRDVKPANVLVDQFGRHKLGDFGIAGLNTGALTTNGATPATVAYADPQVLLGERATPQSDVYSLGATLFALLTGEPAHTLATDKSVVPMLLRITTEPFPGFGDRLVPPVLAAVVQQLMERDPADRPETAEQARALLVQVRDSLASARGAAEPEVAATPLITAVPRQRTEREAPQGERDDAEATIVRPAFVPVATAHAAAPSGTPEEAVPADLDPPGESDQPQAAPLAEPEPPLAPVAEDESVEAPPEDESSKEGAPLDDGLAASTADTEPNGDSEPDSDGESDIDTLPDARTAPAPVVGTTDPDLTLAGVPGFGAKVPESGYDPNATVIRVTQPGSDLDEEPPPAESRRRRPIALVAALIAVIAATAVALTLTGSKPASAATPRVEGLDQAAATRRLAAAGVDEQDIDVAFTSGDPKRAGEVVDQSPNAGEKLKNGEHVTITVIGEPVKLPNLSGKTQAEATRALKDLGLQVKVVEAASDRQPRGKVVIQDPKAGNDVASESTVTLTVSNGPRTPTVPNLVGLKIEDAKTKLTAHQMKVMVTFEFSDQPVGTVLTQSIKAGARRSKGTTVALTVSKGPAPTTTTEARTTRTTQPRTTGTTAPPVTSPPVTSPPVTEPPCVETYIPGYIDEFTGEHVPGYYECI